MQTDGDCCAAGLITSDLISQAAGQGHSPSRCSELVSKVSGHLVQRRSNAVRRWQSSVLRSSALCGNQPSGILDTARREDSEPCGGAAIGAKYQCERHEWRNEI